MTKKDDFWGILQKSHRNQDAVTSTGKFLIRPGEERHRLGSGYGSSTPYRFKPVLHSLQAVGGHVCAELEAPGHAAFVLGVAVAVVLVPNQPTQQAHCMGVGPRPRLTRFLPVYNGSGGRTWS